MSKVPVVTGQRLIKALHKIGFEVIRRKGSHNLMAQIMRDCEISTEELKNIL